MIVLNVTYRCKPGKREEFLKAVGSEGIDVLSRGENGNLKYDYYLSNTDPDELLLIEKWADQSALEAHWQMPHFKKLGGLKEEYMEDTDIAKYSAEE